jgi:hypothetical protein
MPRPPGPGPKAIQAVPDSPRLHRSFRRIRRSLIVTNYNGPPSHSAITGIDPKLDSCIPPAAVLHGTGDQTIADSVRYAARLYGLGVFTRIQMVEDGNHGLAGKEDEFMSFASSFLHEVLTGGGRPREANRYEAGSYSRKLFSRLVQTPAGFTGTGALELAEAKSYVEWGYIDVPSTAECLFSFRYLHRSPETRSCELRVNGEAVRVEFQPAATWTTTGVKAGLKAGRNAVRSLTGAGHAGLLLDRLDVRPNQ